MKELKKEFKLTMIFTANTGVFIITGFIWIFSMSCTQTVHKKLCDTLQEKLKEQDSCLIKLSSVTSFSWDTMHIFMGPVFDEYIENKYKIKVKTKQISDDYDMYVFLKGHKNVYEEVVQRRSGSRCPFGAYKDHQALPYNQLYKARKVRDTQFEREYYITMNPIVSD